MIQVVLIAAMAAQAATAPSRLASVQVKGVSRYTPQEVTRLSGLEIGKPVAAADLTAAANRLAATGLFDSVKYTYTTGAVANVVLEITEASWTVPVILDNFVWLSDDDVKSGVRKEVPSFDGTAPLNAGAAEFIARALQKVIESKSIPGRVDFLAQHDSKRQQLGYVYAIKDPSPKVCVLHVNGASVISERELLEPLKSVAGADYSRFFLQTAADGTLTDMYRRKGYWAATFKAPAAALDSCGVAVTLNVDEGAQYTWAGAEWSGVNIMAADALDKLLGIKPGDVADLTRIDSGLRQVHNAYLKKGHIRQDAAFEPRLDTAARKAVFTIAVQEGPEFRMGTLAFPGIRESDAASLSKKFPLKAGDVYDQIAVIKYEREVLSALQTSAGGRAQLQEEAAGDRVNVAVVFK